MIVRATILMLLIAVPLSYSQGTDSDYSKFLHSSSKHSSIGCAGCHHRTDNSSRPTFPSHKDCTGCHLTQFTTPNIPMCSICHLNVNGNDPPRKPFPDRFKESFNVSFDHAQHMTGEAKPKNGCTSCHNSPLRRGAAWSIPARLSAHDGCFTWHTPNSQSNGRDLASCGVCHAQHSSRQRLNCSECHSYKAGLPQRRQVDSPRALEHFPTGNRTCATCHNGRRSFGGDLDFKNCARCHKGSSFRMGT